MASAAAVVTGSPESLCRTQSPECDRAHTHCSTTHRITHLRTPRPIRPGPSTRGATSGETCQESKVTEAEARTDAEMKADEEMKTEAEAEAEPGSEVILSHGGLLSPVKIWAARSRVDPAQVIPGFSAMDTTGRTKFLPSHFVDRRSVDLVDVRDGALGRVVLSQLVPAMAPPQPARGRMRTFQGFTAEPCGGGSGAPHTHAAPRGSPGCTRGSPGCTAGSTPGEATRGTPEQTTRQGTREDSTGGRRQEVGMLGSAAAVKKALAKGCRLQTRMFGTKGGGRRAGEERQREVRGEGDRSEEQRVMMERVCQSESDSEEERDIGSESEEEEEEEDDGDSFVFRVPATRIMAQAKCASTPAMKAQAEPKDWSTVTRSATVTPTSVAVTPSSPTLAPRSATVTPRLVTVTLKGTTVTFQPETPKPLTHRRDTVMPQPDTVTSTEDNGDSDDEGLFRFSPRSSAALSSLNQLSPTLSDPSLSPHPASLASDSASLAPRSASLAEPLASLATGSAGLACQKQAKQGSPSRGTVHKCPSAPPTGCTSRGHGGMQGLRHVSPFHVSSTPGGHPNKGSSLSPAAGLFPADAGKGHAQVAPASVARAGVAARPSYRIFSLAELACATNSWHPGRVVGRGSYGMVYRGRIEGQDVAIKRLDSQGHQGPREYFREIQILSKFRHKHIVHLLGACPEGHCLVFEFVSGGSLQDCIARESERRNGERGEKGSERAEGSRGNAGVGETVKGVVSEGMRAVDSAGVSGVESGSEDGVVSEGISEGGRPTLQWPEKAGILAGLASALVALHQSEPPVVHRDLKPQNVLLSYDTATSNTTTSSSSSSNSIHSKSNSRSSRGSTSNMNSDSEHICTKTGTVIEAKLADVGMARLMEGEADANKTYTVSGTVGYIDPESMRDYSVLPMADVYGFGLIGLQLMLCEPKVLAVHRMLEALPEGAMRDGPYPSPFAVQHVGQLIADVDPTCPCHVAEVLALMLLKCLQRRRVYRPDLAADVLPTLQKLSAWGSPGRGRNVRAPGSRQQREGGSEAGLQQGVRESSVRARHVRAPCSLPVNLLPQPMPLPQRSASWRQLADRQGS